MSKSILTLILAQALAVISPHITSPLGGRWVTCPAPEVSLKEVLRGFEKIWNGSQIKPQLRITFCCDVVFSSEVKAHEKPKFVICKFSQFD